MPDWSYHPLLKPLSVWLPTPARRTLALGGLHLVEALPGGALLVDFLGDMKPDPSLSIAPYGKALASPIGLGGGVDPDASPSARWAGLASVSSRWGPTP